MNPDYEELLQLCYTRLDLRGGRFNNESSLMYDAECTRYSSDEIPGQSHRTAGTLGHRIQSSVEMPRPDRNKMS